MVINNFRANSASYELLQLKYVAQSLSYSSHLLNNLWIQVNLSIYGQYLDRYQCTTQSSKKGVVNSALGQALVRKSFKSDVDFKA